MPLTPGALQGVAAETAGLAAGSPLKLLCGGGAFDDGEPHIHDARLHGQAAATVNHHLRGALADQGPVDVHGGEGR